MDFFKFNEDDTDDFFESWLNDSHARVYYESSWIGSHTVNRATNARKLVNVIQWNTSDERATRIIFSKRDAHQAHISGKRTSVTSAHKTNLNPAIGTGLIKIHITLVRVCKKGKRMGVFNNVAKENNTIKSDTLSNGAPTRWISWYAESNCANINQADLATALASIINPDGIDKNIWKENQGNLSQLIPTGNNWTMYQQYEATTAPTRQYIKLSQFSHVMVHLEIFEGRMAIERMSARFFKMYDNLSVDNGARSGYLINRSLNQMVRSSQFILDESDKVNCVKIHIMLESIAM